MTGWAEKADDLQRLLRLKTDPLAFRRLEKREDLDKIRNVFRVPYTFSFCQVPFLARINGLTVGVTAEDKMMSRCMRIHGLQESTEETMEEEAGDLSKYYFCSLDESIKQQHDYPRVPVAEAIIVAPLKKEKFEPEVILIFGNPAQMAFLMSGLQRAKYERFQFFFIGEGACADSVAQCYASGKPALSVPCLGERVLGQVADDELLMALPPEYVDGAIFGMQKLAKVGYRYPISFLGGQTDVGRLTSR